MSQPDPHLPEDGALDPAQQSLADALRTSFLILKVAMAVMAVAYLFSGIFTVKPQEKAVRLLFGQVVTDAAGTPHEYETGTYWGWPFPIERVVRVPVDAHPVEVLQTFLPKLTEDERKAFGNGDIAQIAQSHPSLNPVKDGSLITADAGLVHIACKAEWKVRGIKQFLTQIGDADKGDLLVHAAIERGLVHMAAMTPTDDILYSREKLGGLILQLAQEALPADCGIEISGVEIKDAFPPLPTRQAFEQVSSARSEQDKLLSQANQYAARTLGEAAGPAQTALRDLISLEEIASLREGPDGALTRAVQAELSLSFEKLLMAGPTVETPAAAYMHAVTSGADAQTLASARTGLQTALAAAADGAFVRTGPRIEGHTRTLMAESEAYRTASVQALYAEAHAFEAQLAQYKKNPLIFMTRRWQTMRENVFTSPTVETFFVPVERLSIETGRDPEAASKVDELLFNERKQKAGVQ